jgi:hypothetical protein
MPVRYEPTAVVVVPLNVQDHLRVVPEHAAPSVKSAVDSTFAIRSAFSVRNIEIWWAKSEMECRDCALVTVVLARIRMAR